MKILLDEDTPAPLKRHLVAHEVTTVPQMGWAGVKNGVLLRLIESADFDVFLTCDQNLEYQQNLTALPFAIVVFCVPDKKMATLLPLVPQLLALFPTTLPGHLYHVSITMETEPQDATTGKG